MTPSDDDMVLVRRGDLRNLARTVCGPHGELDWLGPPSNVDNLPAHPTPDGYVILTPRYGVGTARQVRASLEEAKRVASADAVVYGLYAVS